MTVREIVREYLELRGFDGLSGVDCGCECADLMPCMNDDMADCRECSPARKGPCPGPDGECSADGGCPWHMVPVQGHELPKAEIAAAQLRVALRDLLAARHRPCAATLWGKDCGCAVCRAEELV